MLALRCEVLRAAFRRAHELAFMLSGIQSEQARDLSLYIQQYRKEIEEDIRATVASCASMGQNVDQPAPTNFWQQKLNEIVNRGSDRAVNRNSDPANVEARAEAFRAIWGARY